VQDCQDVTTVRRLIQALAGRGLDDLSQHFLEQLKARFQPTGSEWNNLIDYEIWTKHLAEKVPKFFYFDDYYLLPGKVNIPSLAAHAATPDELTEEDRTALNLLNLAGVTLDELTAAQGYESVKARLESLSNAITDTIFQYWTQDQELDVEFDIRTDPADRPPFDDGPNLYVRIRSRRHRVTVPFQQRSKGFIWFFSFIVWFKTIQQQYGVNAPLILLFDEPGLNLHALAQRDFLRYIDALSESHQILYSTHSPFLIPGDRLAQVRLVEDRKDRGTVVTADLADGDPRTLFPLQAALAYALARDLLPARRNLLVRGPADLVILKFFSAALDRAGRTGLREDVTIVPVGGLDRVATFVALLGADRPELVVLHADPGPIDVPALRPKNVLGYGQFRDPAAKGKPAIATPAAGVEDLFSVNFYLKVFNAAYAKKLPGEVKANDLPAADRLTDRLADHLSDHPADLRFSPDAVASHLASNPPKPLDKETLTRFEALFKKVNALFSGTPG
jgi:hypothetical protein